MLARLLPVIFLLIGKLMISQTDSVIYTPGTVLEDGVYLSYEDFRANNSIKKNQVISSLDKNQLDFIGKSLSEKVFEYTISGEKHSVEADLVFAFVQNNTMYINYRGLFYRIPVFGAISYFVANAVVHNAFYDPRFGYPSTTMTTTEVREFVMDFYEGKILDLTMDKAKELLSRDAGLYSEFKKLGRRKQKEELYRYIRKYNELHPVYFLKN